MEGKAARIVRYAVLAVFLCLGLGVAAASLLLAWGDQGTQLRDMLGLAMLAAGAAVLGAWCAWAGLHQCRPAGVFLGLVLLTLFTVAVRGVSAMAYLTGEERGISRADVWLLALWALAILGAVLALRERRRRLDRASGTE
jgi:ABC-type Mn2+/Zn2+ transport system permease subunit